MQTQTGKLVILLGLAVILIGIVIYLGKWKAWFGWIGHLPGDINIQRENFSFFFPITTMLLLSLVVHLLRKVLG